jgi:hypothetical protein
MDGAHAVGPHEYSSTIDEKEHAEGGEEMNYAIDRNVFADVFAKQKALLSPLSFLSLAGGGRQLKSSYEGKRRNPPAFLSANLEHLLGLQVGEIPSLGGAVFLGESHPGAEHRNFLLDLHADRLRRRTVGRCPKIVNGEAKESLGRCSRFGVRCVRAIVQTANGSTFGVLIEPSLRSNSCVLVREEC